MRKDFEVARKHQKLAYIPTPDALMNGHLRTRRSTRATSLRMLYSAIKMNTVPGT
jgi:hypothetical protein